jgi:YHYH protein
MFRLILISLIATATIAHADPILTSWFTQNSGMLARVIQNGSTQTTPLTTWPSSGITNNNTGGAAQTVPAYADVQRIRYTAADVYINANGFASYNMGPWFTQGGGLFGFWPLARDYQVRITRSPMPAATKTRHPGGMIGMMVNGVAIYDLGDAFSFHQTANSPSVTGTDQMGASGDGWWSRDALAVEVVTFDPGFAHQPGNNGQYHYHAQPKALRYQLGDNVQATYNATTNTNTYTEDTSGLHHSPILGWAYDGYPIYGPYGYSSAMNAASPVTRMRTGFVLRNGQNGTQDLRVTGRVTMSKWAAAVFGIANPGNTNPVTLPAAQYGPTTTYQTTGPGGVTTYSLGRYCGDYDFLGDLGQTQGVGFDLDTYNGRNCVTPEFPGGTYAYFVTIDATGNTAFPHMLGKQYYGTPNAGTAPTVPGTAAELFNGGPNTNDSWRGGPGVNPVSGNVTLTWSSVEGGTYQVEASGNLSTWTPVATGVSATANSTQTSVTENAAALPTNNTKRFYKVTRTAVAPYDPAYTGQ